MLLRAISNSRGEYTFRSPRSLSPVCSLLEAAFCILLVSALLQAQTAGSKITGVISDPAGAAVQNAAIEARNLQTGEEYKTASEEDGRFALPGLTPGKYELNVSLTGFKQHTRREIAVYPNRDTRVSIVLEIESIREDITVHTSSPLQLMDRPLEEPAALRDSMTSIDQIQMEKQGSKTIIDALKYVPGAWTESRGRKVKQFVSFRGQKYPYPEYSVDGATFREFYEVPYFFSVGDVERIEVLRSSASLLQGFSGLAGVIDIVPRQYQERETSWLAEYGSRNSYRVHVSHGDKIGDVSYGLGLDSSRNGGPDDRRGNERMLNLFGTVEWQPSQSLTMRANLFHLYGRRELVQALPPAGGRFQHNVETFDPIQTSVLTFKTLYKPKGWASTQFTLGYSNRENTFISETGDTVQATPDYDHELNLNLIEALELSGNNVLRIGANYNHWVAPYGKRFYVGRRTDLETASFTVVDEHSFGRLLLDGGLRYQRTYINEYGAFNIEGSGNAFTNVDPIMDTWDAPQISGSIGATYSLSNRFALRGNLLTGAIEPRNGTLTAEMEEPKTEHRTMVDAGVELSDDEYGKFSLVAFYIRQSDAIVLTGETVDLNGRTLELYANRDQDTTGLEFEFKSRPVYDRVNLLFNVTAMNPRARDAEGSMVRDIEKPRVIMSMGIEGNQWKLDYNFFWKFVSGYQSSRFTSSLQPLGDYNTFNLNLGHPLGSYENTKIYLELTNLTDNRYSTVVGYPDYGRSFQVGVRQQF